MEQVAVLCGSIVTVHATSNTSERAISSQPLRSMAVPAVGRIPGKVVPAIRIEDHERPCNVSHPGQMVLGTLLQLGPIGVEVPLNAPLDPGYGRFAPRPGRDKSIAPKTLSHEHNIVVPLSWRT